MLNQSPESLKNKLNSSIHEHIYVLIDNTDLQIMNIQLQYLISLKFIIRLKYNVISYGYLILI